MTAHLRGGHARANPGSGLKSHAVAELLGHADAGLVDRLYGYALPDELASAGAVLEQWRASRRS